MKINKEHSLNDKLDDNSKCETLLNFPERFPIKIFGLESDVYRQSVKEIIDNYVEKPHVLDWQENFSSKGNYLAITVTIMAQNKSQLDNIYMDLTSNAHVKMAL